MREQRKLTIIIVVSVILLDQILKHLVSNYIDLYAVGFSIFGDFIRIVHIRNTAVAFGIGSSFPEWIKLIFFKIIPILFLLYLFYFQMKNKMKKLEFISFSLIIAGGLGNLADRLFRPLGVVDFIDVKIYGLFGLQRWPVFNIADSAVVIAVALLLIDILFKSKKEKKDE